MEAQEEETNRIFDEFESYRFSDDAEFRAGLPTVIAAIRGKDRSADQIDEMIGRAQWFYFTRLKGVSIPWEDYARRQITHPYVDPSSPSTGLVLSRTGSGSPSTSTTKLPRSPLDALQTLNNLAEARMMMKEATGSEEESTGAEGLSFGMLSRLISEGRTGEVPMKQIPEGTNETQPSQPVMRARPKPWEQTSPSQSTFHPYKVPRSPRRGSSQSQGQVQGQISPVLFQHQPQYQSYGSSSTNSPNLQHQPARNSYDGIYNQPSSSSSTQWATSGPTISPDLSFETFRLDPDYSCAGLSLDQGQSQGQGQGSTTSFLGTMSNTTGSMSGSSLDFNTTQTSFDDTTFSNYLNVDYDPNNPSNDLNQLNLAPPIALSLPGIFPSSSSTPAPPQEGRQGQSSTTDHTAATSHSV